MISTRNPDAGDDRVTVIGLGLMGQALAAALVKDGHPTTVWNRSADKARQLVEQGATLAGSLEEGIGASPLVVVCVSDYRAVREILDPVEGVLAGRVLVNLSSGTSQQAREIAEWASARDLAYLDGVIMAIPAGIGTADAVLLYSGPSSAFDRHAATLQSLGGHTTHLGPDPGLSSLYEMAVASIMWNVLNGFLHGTALLAGAGVTASAFVPVATTGIATVAEWLPAYADQVDDGRYPVLDSTIDTHLQAMGHLIHECDSRGVSSELPRLIRTIADRAVADGRGGEGYAAVIEQFRG